MEKPSVLSADYPGGNIIVEKVEAGRARLSPDFRHMQEGTQWFYWSFRARNVEPLTAVFAHRNHISVRGPAVSRDGGCSWEWLGMDKVATQKVGEHEVELSFEIPPVPAQADVRYAFCPQYQESHLQNWLRRHEGHPSLEVSELCRSRGGRPVERIRIGNASGGRKIVLTARNHSCEAAASFVLEGILEAALADDELGRQLRDRWEIVAIPFMDKDGVEEGDQGKLRHPHDHNRDYNEKPIYPEVAALMRFGAETSCAVAAFLDLHCPMVHGVMSNRFYLVGSADSGIAARQEAFMDVFRGVRSGPIDAGPEGVLHFGKAWNTVANYTAGRSAAAWAGDTFRDAGIIASFEIPYADADGAEVNPATARSLGRDLASTLLHHLGEGQ